MLLLDLVYRLSVIMLLMCFQTDRYVLLHHVMAEVAGIKGSWGYPEGGMGGVTQAMARAATKAGAHLFTNKVLVVCVCVCVCVSSTLVEI